MRRFIILIVFIVYILPKTTAEAHVCVSSNVTPVLGSAADVKGYGLKIQEYLSGQAAYTRNRKIIRKFPRRPIKAFRINELWEADIL